MILVSLGFVINNNVTRLNILRFITKIRLHFSIITLAFLKVANHCMIIGWKVPDPQHRCLQIRYWLCYNLCHPHRTVRKMSDTVWMHLHCPEKRSNQANSIKTPVWVDSGCAKNHWVINKKNLCGLVNNISFNYHHKYRSVISASEW